MMMKLDDDDAASFEEDLRKSVLFTQPADTLNVYVLTELLKSHHPLWTQYLLPLFCAVSLSSGVSASDL